MTEEIQIENVKLVNKVEGKKSPIIIKANSDTYNEVISGDKSDGKYGDKSNDKAGDKSNEKGGENIEKTAGKSVSILEETPKLRDQPSHYDQGWSWVILAAVFYIMFVAQLLGPSFGVMFKSYFVTHEIRTATITWIFNVQMLTWNIFGLFVGPLCNILGWRKVSVFGSLVTFGAFIATAFTKDVYILFITYSFLSGIGSSLLVTVSLYILPHYFRRKIGLANAIMMAGSSLGLFSNPPLILYLQRKLDFQYSTLILSSFFLLAAFISCVYRPTRSVKSSKDNMPFQTIGLLAFTSTMTSGVVAGIDRKSKRLSSRFGPQMESIFMQFFKALLSSIKVLRYKKAIVIAIVASTIFNSFFNCLALCPVMMSDASLSSWALSTSAVTSFIGKFGFSIISDLKPFRNRKGFLLMIGIIILFGGIIGFSFVSTDELKIVMMGVQGLGGGIFISLYPLVIVQYMGVKLMPDTFGIASLFVAFGSITIGPITGYMKTVFEKDSAVIQTLSGFTFLGFIVCALMPWAEKLDKRKEESEAEKAEDIQQETYKFLELE